MVEQASCLFRRRGNDLSLTLSCEERGLRDAFYASLPLFVGQDTSEEQ
jgi:hypothetical protein